MITNPSPSDEAAPTIAVVPEPDPVTVLQDQNRALQETIEMLTGQCESHQTAIKRLTEEKDEILTRLRAHEDNAFAMVMANLDGGNVAHLASEKILELAELIEQRQEPGKFSLVITMKPFNTDGAQTASAEIKVTEPKPEAKRSIFFLADGKLTRQSQRQENLNF